MEQKTKKSTLVAVCGLSSALSLALLFVGGAAYVLAYTVPMITGILNKCLDSTFGKGCALITYVSTSLLSLMLVTDKECAMMYVFCFGIYPVLQDDINKIKSRVLRIGVKLLFFNSLLAICQLILIYVFGIPFLEEGDGKYFILIFAAGMNFVFFLYDSFLLKLVFLYSKTLEKHIKKIIK